MLTIFNNLKEFFEDNYKAVSIREYARIKKISPPHASKILNNLQKEGLLDKEEDRGYHFFKAGRENPIFKSLQHAYYQQKLSNLIVFIEEEFFSPVIILFGSFAKAEIIEKSDIDIAIFTKSTKSINLEKFEKKLGREIQLFIFKDQRSIKNKELLHNILNGVKLAGSWS
jgi:predicted nucleotidyltransferase